MASQSYLEVYRGQPLPGEQRVHLSKSGAILRQTDETSAVTTLAADPGGEWMACGYDDGLVELWDLQTMTCPKTIACSTGVGLTQGRRERPQVVLDPSLYVCVCVCVEHRQFVGES